jgi:hypothetical protein
MRESLREYATSIGRWWLLVIVPLIFSGVSAYLDISGDGPIPTWVWVLAPAAGLVTASFIPFAKVRSERDEAHQQVRDLEENLPSIEVTTGSDALGSMFLEATNLGERGDFEAQIDMLEGHESIHGIVTPPLPIYKGYWQTSAGPTARLPQGHKDRLLIGALDLSIETYLAEFKMYFCSAAGGQAVQYGTTSWGVMKGSGGLPARFVLRITISSTPRMKEGPFIRTYVVDGGSQPHFQEVAEPVSTG